MKAGINGGERASPDQILITSSGIGESTLGRTMMHRATAQTIELGLQTI